MRMRCEVLVTVLAAACGGSSPTSAAGGGGGGGGGPGGGWGGGGGRGGGGRDSAGGLGDDVRIPILTGDRAGRRGQCRRLEQQWNDEPHVHERHDRHMEQQRDQSTRPSAADVSVPSLRRHARWQLSVHLHDRRDISVPLRISRRVGDEGGRDRHPMT